MAKAGTEKKTTHDMTEGTIWKQILLFSAPLLLGNIFQQFYSTIDSVVVGNYVGSDALGAVTANLPAINTLIGLFFGFSGGASVVISHYFGAKDEERLRKTVHTAVLASLIIGLALTVIGIIISPALVRLMNTPESVAPGATQYLRIFFAGLIGLCIYNIGSAVLRAVGDSRRPLYFLIFSSVMNILLDLLFVIRFRLGVPGVAYATILSQFLSSILVLFVLFRSKAIYRLRLPEMRIDGAILKQVILLGIPAAIQMGLTSFSNLFVQGYVNRFGAASTAGWGAYQRIDAFATLPAFSIGLAVMTFVGQNAGAGKYDRIKKGWKDALALSLIVTVSMSLLLFLFAPRAIGLFNKEFDVLFFGSLYLRMITPFTCMHCFIQVFSGTLRGLGDAKAPMLIMLTSFVAFRQTYLFIASHLTESVYPIALGFPVGWVLCTILLIFYYRRKMRQYAELLNTPLPSEEP